MTEINGLGRAMKRTAVYLAALWLARPFIHIFAVQIVLDCCVGVSLVLLYWGGRRLRRIGADLEMLAARTRRRKVIRGVTLSDGGSE